MVSCDGAGASHGLIARLEELAARPGYQLVYSVGWDLGARERVAITRVPEGAWRSITAGRCGSVALRAPARTSGVRMSSAGTSKRTSPS